MYGGGDCRCRCCLDGEDLRDEVAALKAEVAALRAERGAQSAGWIRCTEMRLAAEARVGVLEDAAKAVLDDETGDYDFIKWSLRRALEGDK
jgi:hypothetical protein